MVNFLGKILIKKRQDFSEERFIRKGMKGQVFVAGAILILVLISITYISLKYNDVDYNEFLIRDIQNIDNEFRFSSFSGHESVNHFMSYLYTDMGDFKGIYFVFEKDGSNVNLNIGSFLRAKTRISIESLQINETVILSDNQTANYVFSSSPNVLYVEYGFDGVVNKESIELVDGRTSFIDFMIDGRDFVRKKSVYFVKSDQ